MRSDFACDTRMHYLNIAQFGYSDAVLLEQASHSDAAGNMRQRFMKGTIILSFVKISSTKLMTWRKKRHFVQKRLHTLRSTAADPVAPGTPASLMAIEHSACV